jgi:hypothetical protein
VFDDLIAVAREKSMADFMLELEDQELQGQNMADFMLKFEDQE